MAARGDQWDHKNNNKGEDSDEYDLSDEFQEEEITNYNM